MSDVAISELTKTVIDAVREVIEYIRPRLIESALSGKHGEKNNSRHEDNFLSVYDLELHRMYRSLFKKTIREFVYASEEGDPEIIGNDSDPDLLVLVDPLDTSELAVRGLLGYTHVLIYSRSLARPVAAVVGDLFHHIQLYVGTRTNSGHDEAYLVVEGGEPRAIRPRGTLDVNEALITNYLMRPGERFMPLARQVRLLETLDRPSDDGKSRGRIGVDFGSVGLCHVAAGFTDALIEFAKGFAIWDLSPGHYILHAAGGHVIDLAGSPLPLNYQLDTLTNVSTAMGRRQKFIAAATSELAGQILEDVQI